MATTLASCSDSRALQSVHFRTWATVDTEERGESVCVCVCVFTHVCVVKPVFADLTTRTLTSKNRARFGMIVSEQLIMLDFWCRLR